MLITDQVATAPCTDPIQGKSTAVYICTRRINFISDGWKP